MPPEFVQRQRNLEQRRQAIGGERNRISFSTDLSIKIFAISIDLIGMIFFPLAAFAGIVGTVSLFLFYIFLGVKPLQKGSGRKSLIVRLVSFVIEIIPFPPTGVLPAFSLSVFYTNSLIKKEDKEHNKRIKSDLAALETDERTLQYDMQNAAYAEAQEAVNTEEKY